MENASESNATSAAATSCRSRALSARVDRRVLYAGLGVAAATGLFAGWDWLVAVGLSTVVIALLPCLVMCAIGACAMRTGRSKTTGAGKIPVPPVPPVAQVPPLPDVASTKRAADAESDSRAPAARVQ